MPRNNWHVEPRSVPILMCGNIKSRPSYPRWTTLLEYSTDTGSAGTFRSYNRTNTLIYIVVVVKYVIVSITSVHDFTAHLLTLLWITLDLPPASQRCLSAAVGPTLIILARSCGKARFTNLAAVALTHISVGPVLD
jgi:hypothetical protein